VKKILKRTEGGVVDVNDHVQVEGGVTMKESVEGPDETNVN